ncbi:hypothetical protein IKQ21_07210 [bacterium]|nr:hypothetical protein [bacterium]
MKISSMDSQNFEGLKIKSPKKWPTHILEEFSSNNEIKKLVDVFEKNGYDVNAKFISKNAQYGRKILRMIPQLDDVIELSATAFLSSEQHIRTVYTDSIKFFNAKRAINEYNTLRQNVGMTDKMVKIYRDL